MFKKCQIITCTGLEIQMDCQKSDGKCPTSRFMYRVRKVPWKNIVLWLPLTFTFPVVLSPKSPLQTGLILEFSHQALIGWKFMRCSTFSGKANLLVKSFIFFVSALCRVKAHDSIGWMDCRLLYTIVLNVTWVLLSIRVCAIMDAPPDFSGALISSNSSYI